MEIFAADPSGRAPVRQLTFGQPAGGLCYSPAACGFMRPQPSPDGHWLAYWSGNSLFGPATLWLARGDGSRARAIGVALDATWSPNSRRLAYSAADGVHVLTPGGTNRITDAREPATLRYSPDGETLAAIDAARLIVLRGGHTRVLGQEEPYALAWSPDGKLIAIATAKGISLVSATTGRARLVYRKPVDLAWFELELAFAPNGRLLAFDTSGVIRLLDLSTSRVRLLPAGGHDVTWAPDGKSLLVVEGGVDLAGDSIASGDVVTVTLGGRVSTVVAAAKPYGGQILSAAWTVASTGLHYRSPERPNGVFAGGPVQELVADGGRVAFIACGGVSSWTPATGEVVALGRQGTCLAEYSRDHVYSLALAGDRLAWVGKEEGLCFQWTAHEETLGGPVLDLGTGSGCLGSAPSAACDGWVDRPAAAGSVTSPRFSSGAQGSQRRAAAPSA
jgi:WD40 repeat protein